MELQRSFTPDYTDKLKYEVKTGFSIDKYMKPEFPLADAETIALKGVEKPEGLLQKLIPDQKYDLQNAITLYEAFQNIPPLIAASEPFWTYLTHADLFEFVQKRRSEVTKGKANNAYILEHWFGSRGNTLGALWWAVHQTIDDNRINKYELTEMLFKYSDVFQNLSTSRTIYPNKDALSAIMEFFIEHPEVLQTASSIRNRFIVQSLNRYGGVKRLSYFSKDDFKAILENNLSTIIRITTSTELSSVLPLWK